MKDKANQLLAHYIHIWKLIPDGNSFHTHSSLLQPVLFNNIPAFIKIPLVDEEKEGCRLMVWWDGDGVARATRANLFAGLVRCALASCQSIRRNT